MQWPFPAVAAQSRHKHVVRCGCGVVSEEEELHEGGTIPTGRLRFNHNQTRLRARYPSDSFRNGVVRFSIVTPSLRQLDWLKLAVRSVADQTVALEHVIQDGGTGPELETWVREHTSARLTAEPDHGMY